MKSASIGIIVIFLVITVESAKNDRNFRPRCQKPRDGQQICTCGKNKVLYDRLKGYTCFRGQVVRTDSVPKALERASLRLTSTPLRQSTRDDIKGSRCIVLQYNRTSSVNNSYVPLRNISVEAWIDSFTADVTLSQVFVNQETNPIEAVYVFPIEENAAIYSFTAEIDNRTIVAELKERKKAEKEYQSAVQQGHSAILMRQSDKTFDTFTINVGALPASKECRITVKYVTELDLVEENSIRFVVPTTIAPRYNPSLGHFQSPDQTPTEYVQNTSYSMTFQAHIHRGENYKIINVANLSHPVDLSSTPETIHITSKNISLDRDIILDIDLPINRPLTSVSVEKYNDTSSHAILLAFTPRLSDIRKISQGKEITEKEFIFIVDCSGSMYEANGIGLAREAMLLFIRSLPVGANFNIIRFGSSYRVLFENEDMTVVYNETTAQIAENLTKSMDANLGGTELLSPLKYLKDHPPVEGRAREIFVLTDGEISNTNEVIELCRSMSSDTRIFSFGLGYSPSRALVKGLARATNGHFVIVEPNAKVDSYVGSQLGRALQPAIVHARLQWHGLSNKGSQAPQQIPPLYVNDRVLVYQLLENGGLIGQNVSVDLMVNDVVINSIKIPSQILHKKDTIRRLAAKALIQELIHKKNSSDQNGDDEYSEEKKEDEEQDENDQSSTIEYITRLSLHYQILSPYTAFVGVETTGPKVNSSQLQVRYVPIQIAKDDEYINSRQNFGRMPYMSMPGMAGMPMQNINYHFYAPMPMASSSHQRPHSYYSLGAPGPSNNQFYGSLQSLHQKTTQRYPMAPQADQFNFGSSGSSATDQLLSTDPVRWLITKQNFDGTWILSENDIQTLTNSTLSGKLQSKLTNNANALTTAFAIAYLETKQSNQKNLWFTLVEKARKQLLNYGLTQTTLQSLIKEFQTELNA